MRKKNFSVKSTTRPERVFLKTSETGLRDKCGIFGIYGKGVDVARISFFGLYSLQHRGQEGAGITVTNGKNLKSVKGLGLVSSVFNEEKINSLKGFAAIGHTRYSTTGGNKLCNVQPVVLNLKDEDFALAHNGNIINAMDLAREIPLNIKLSSTSDTEIMGWIIKNYEGRNWEDKILASFNKFQGAFSMISLTKNKIIAFRDTFGFRPLVLGQLNDSYVVCSETCALDTVGAKFIREVAPGEIIVIDEKGVHTVGKVQSIKKRFCLFEFVYLARPDSIFDKQLVHQVRQRSGEILAHESPIGADMVVAVPDSGTSAAIGYSKASGIPYGEVLIKNRYIGRTFIQPEQNIREMGVRIKFNPLKEIVKGKRIIIVDDSIVRGTTIKKIVKMLKNCGAKKVHIRVCSPPVTDPCYFGIDTPDKKQLIASHMKSKEIRKFIGADSLAYLSLKGLKKASRIKSNKLCDSCFTGKYPMPVKGGFRKDVFETIV
ncbi:amidophosphoribosyltransferase [Candidatus Roizmanbacteria bacterium CG_4_9_14_3_um_filter_33_18]|uniref:Amidophosphoribosyltransferase n=3 Tax=Candidatus Roizmaniibacteriota TaxID=1752723 RepID=A0A2M7U8L6_9BACT|nr:MAG: amidophosphoribosyltransferase [Candidatus Roizmanbacteria bacterium CG22_combo_CG10-13_8_21_14_all_34_12]PIZ67576.1 MAG: amidophosphoribosyltransferase [Candidatus Roizmanbacteria bacterium CG_4_10_14_0_2_um_filter_33_96]PJA55337.1 MAG: amidophosphoribosyltransferase [Candidatus Roizmanbacteria bacterium CG_4_9_14_3_um_filter_33_18]